MICCSGWSAGWIVSLSEKREIELAVVAMLYGGHILLEDVPGVGKTMLVRTLAACLGGSFGRIQFTSDLMPSDVTGVTVYHAQSGQFEFRPGPVFSHIVLADEINRAAPRTQSALLEAMEERKVTVDGVTRALPKPFCCWPRKIRWNTRGPTACLRHSWTAF